MARMTATFFSAALGTTTHAEIIFPMRLPIENVPDRVLYLLHGMSGGCTDWTDYTRIAHYANQHNFIVIMPEVQNSFYFNMAHGYDYFTYVAHELPTLAEHMLNVKHVRGKTFVAGLSMGGYGALKIALSRPEFFCAGASFSGALDANLISSHLSKQDEWHKKLAISILGENLQVPDSSCLLKLSSKLAQSTEKPRILVTCGTEDFLLDANRLFDAHMKELPFDYIYKEWAGAHDWNFWEESLPVMFDFFNKEGEFA